MISIANTPMVNSSEQRAYSHPEEHLLLSSSRKQLLRKANESKPPCSLHGKNFLFANLPSGLTHFELFPNYKCCVIHLIPPSVFLHTRHLNMISTSSEFRVVKSTLPHL